MKIKPVYYLYFLFLTALLATLGSVFFGEILKLPPCTLCWYQRIAIWPLVFIFGVGAWFEDRKVFYYALPAVLIGWGLSIYHNLLSMGIVPEAMAPCTNGVSCAVNQTWFGFITIPLLSFVALTMMLAALLLYRRSTKLETKEVV